MAKPKKVDDDVDEDSENEDLEQSESEDEQASSRGDQKVEYDPPEVLSDMHWQRRQIGDLVGKLRPRLRARADTLQT